MSSSSESDAVDASDAALLRTVNVAASMVSLFASLLVCFSYLRWSELRSFAFRLVFFLVLSDALYALGNLLNDPATGTLCYLQSVIISFFGLASVLWSACIAFSLHMAFQHERFEYEENMPTYHLVVWGLSALMTVLPLFTHSYGINNGWCWISQGSEYSTLWRFVQLYIPIWVSIFYSCWVQVHAVGKLQTLDIAATRYGVRSIAAERMAHSRALMGRIRYYPFALLFCYSFGTINRVYLIFYDPVLWLSVAHVLLASSQGLVNAVVWGWTREVRERLLQTVHCACCDRCACCARCFDADNGTRFAPLALDEEGLEGEGEFPDAKAAARAAEELEEGLDGLDLVGGLSRALHRETDGLVLDPAGGHGNGNGVATAGGDDGSGMAADLDFDFVDERSDEGGSGGAELQRLGSAGSTGSGASGGGLSRAGSTGVPASAKRSAADGI